MRKPRFSMSQHAETGQILKDIQRCLDRMSQEVRAAYPLKTKAVGQIERAYDAIFETKQSLLSEIKKENPEQPVIELDAIYYSSIEDDLNDDDIRKLTQKAGNDVALSYN